MARSTKATDIAPNPWAGRLTWLALGMTLALLIARGTMQEYLREPFDVRPGSEAMPHSAGPATSIGLDLLCCIPALLVLLRRWIDGRSRLLAPMSFIPLALLSVWMLASVSWSADKFSALVTACHWAAAMAMLWASMQLVRDWVKLRLVAAVVFGLLAVYVIQGVLYETIELPDLIKNVTDNRQKILKERDMIEGSFAATHFMDKLKMGELFGFETSPNSFGALLSLLIVVSGGLLIHRAKDRDTARWGVPAIAIGMLLGVGIMGYTRSRTAFATLGIAIVLLLLIWRFRDVLSRRANVIYLCGVVMFAIGVAAVIGHGVAHGSLVHSSLTFRWHYWVGSVGVFMEHPLRGVGWNNFSLHYLAHRLPKAPEEIKDPHNFIVRFFTELGLVGGLLMVAWQLLFWWELTRPTLPPIEATPAGRQPGVIKFISVIAGIGVLLGLLLGVDLSMSAVELEIMNRLLFLAALVLCGSLAALRALHSQEPDDRPAPWLLYSVLVGLGVFLIHNLIDFSLFEIGPMLVFAVLAGSALGIRQAGDCSVRTVTNYFRAGLSPARKEHRAGDSPALKSSTSARMIGVIFAMASALWVAAAVLLFGPILQAERTADAADQLIRSSPSTVANATEGAYRANRLASAANLLAEANDDVWHFNSDYAYRAAAVSPTHWSELIDEAIRENPREFKYYRFRAAGAMHQPNPSAAHVKSDFATAVRLDPNNVPLHLEYGDVLAKLGDPAGAKLQYEAALRYDDLLNWDEKKRLKPEEIREVRRKMAELR